jgi:hypothetical protein
VSDKTPEEILRNFHKMAVVLSEDVSWSFREADTAWEDGKQDDARRAGRTAARALFAWIEAVVWNMKQTALVVGGRESASVFTPAEIAVLREKDAGLKDDGTVYERPSRLRAEHNLRFAFGAFARAIRSDHRLQGSSVEWTTYRKAVSIRDRLMHPKIHAELKIDREDLTVLRATGIWFAREFRDATTRANAAIEATATAETDTVSPGAAEVSDQTLA